MYEPALRSFISLALECSKVEQYAEVADDRQLGARMPWACALSCCGGRVAVQSELKSHQCSLLSSDLLPFSHLCVWVEEEGKEGEKGRTRVGVSFMLQQWC